MRKALRKKLRRIHVETSINVQNAWLSHHGINPQSRKERDREFHKLMSGKREAEGRHG